MITTTNIAQFSHPHRKPRHNRSLPPLPPHRKQTTMTYPGGNPLALLRGLRLSGRRSCLRALSASAGPLRKSDTYQPKAPPPNQPPSRQGTEHAKQPASADKQSSAEGNPGEAGGEHPAKQSDPQQQPSRSTGFGAQSGTEQHKPEEK